MLVKGGPAVYRLTHWGQNKIANICIGIFSNTFSWVQISIFHQISSKITPGGSIDNNLALLQIMAWCQTSYKPSPKAILTSHMASLGHNELTQRCIYSLSAVEYSFGLVNAYIHQWTEPTLVQVIAGCLFSTEPLLKPMIKYCKVVCVKGENFSKILIEMHTFSVKKMHMKMLSAKWLPLLFKPECVSQSA